MEKLQVQQSENYAVKWQQIEYVKSWVDEIYGHQSFYSFSLETLELTKKFNLGYSLFKEKNSIEDFQSLMIISSELEQRLTQEGKNQVIP